MENGAEMTDQAFYRRDFTPPPNYPNVETNGEPAKLVEYIQKHGNPEDYRCPVREE
jgi:hypothetical protein